MNIDPEQLEFLMSQAVDGDISDEDAALLDRCLAEDPDAQAEFERMKRLQGLLSQWGEQSVPVDPNRAGELLSERVREDPEFALSRALDGDEQAEQELDRYLHRDPQLSLVQHQYTKMERLIRAWGSVEPPIDHERLYRRLCQTIHAEAARQQPAWPRRIVRLYAPLAAAASLLIVAGLWWTARPDAPDTSLGIARIEVAFVGPPPTGPKSEEVVEFSFGLADDAPIQTVARADDDNASGVVVSIGGFGSSRRAPNSGSAEMIF